MESFAHGKFSYRLLYKSRFNCYFLPVFWKLMIVLTLFVILPTIAAAIWLFLSERIGEQVMVIIILAGTLGIATPVLVAFVLWAHYKAQKAPILPAGATTLEWDPYSLRVSVEDERRVYFWKDVKRYRGLGQNIVLRFPDGGRTGLFPGKAPREVRASFTAAMAQGKKLNSTAGTGGNGPVIS